MITLRNELLVQIDLNSNQNDISIARGAWISFSLHLLGLAQVSILSLGLASFSSMGLRTRTGLPGYALALILNLWAYSLRASLSFHLLGV